MFVASVLLPATQIPLEYPIELQTGKGAVGAAAETTLQIPASVAEGRDAASTTLADVMTSNPRSVSPNASFNAAMEMMHQGGFRHVPVVEDGRPVGMISARDAMGPELASFVFEILRQEQVSQVLA